MARVPFGLRAEANRGQIPAAATSPPVVPFLAEGVSRPSGHPQENLAERRKKRGAPEVVRTDQTKKLKNVVTEESSNTVSSTFGSVAAEHYTEGDAVKLRGRTPMEGESIFISSLGEAFYHGLQTFTHQSNVIKDQDRLIKKLKGESLAVGVKLENISKKSEEDIKARDAEIVKLKATLEAERREHVEAIESVKGEASRARSEWEAVRKQEQDDLYTEGFLDYLANFLAVDPDYSWEGFPPSTLDFVAGFKEKYATKIEESKGVNARQIERELAQAKGGGNVAVNVGDASASEAGDTGGVDGTMTNPGEVDGRDVGVGNPGEVVVEKVGDVPP